MTKFYLKYVCVTINIFAKFQVPVTSQWQFADQDVSSDGYIKKLINFLSDLNVSAN